MDTKTTCRSCMKSDVLTLFFLFEPIYTDMYANLLLSDALTTCVPVQVSPSDGLPQHLCEDCVKLLLIAYAFRDTTIKSDEALRKLILNTENSQPFFHVKAETKDPEYKVEIVEHDNCTDNNFDESFEDVKFSCVACESSFSTENELNDHKHLSCCVCDKKFKRKGALEKHLKTHNKNIDKKEFHFKTEPTIDSETGSHLVECTSNTDEGRNKYACDICGKKLSLKMLLRRHMKIHLRNKPFKCKECPASYARQDQLTFHQNSKHNGVKSRQCPLCNKAFSQSCNLKDHMRTHTGEQPFLCSVCGRGFNNSSNLRQHALRHTGLKPFACKLCPKRFNSNGQMKAHQNTHTGARPYACEECGATFTQPNSLKKHKMIHLGVRPYECDACSMAFTCKDHLHRHYRIHTGEKPYKCKLCDRAFRQSNDLVKHMRTHVGQNTYQCTICDMRFRLQSELRKHYPSHYTKNDNSIPSDETSTDKSGVLEGNPAKDHPEISITFDRIGDDVNGLTATITIKNNERS